ncbi:hypothetical protein VM98_39210, partial [Streptomyces rubellomurinus subsp. indigoferus]
PAALAAVNDALTRVPTAQLLQWDESGPFRAAPPPPPPIPAHPPAALAAALPHPAPAPDLSHLPPAPDAARLAPCGPPPCTPFLPRPGRRQRCPTRCRSR